MLQLNDHHFLPIYNSLQYLHCNSEGCRESNYSIPYQSGNVPYFQMEIPTGRDVADYALFVVSEAGETQITGTVLFLSETVDGSKAWLTYLGGLATVVLDDCVDYYFRIQYDGRSNQYSERFRLVNFGFDKRAWRLTWYNSVDLDCLLYQVGYRQMVYFENSVLDFPEVIENNETETDGDAVENVVFQSVQVRAALRVPYIPDFWQGVFQYIRKHDTIQLTKLETNETFDLVGKDLTFTSEPQDDCFSIGTFSWIKSVKTVGGCPTNFDLV